MYNETIKAENKIISNDDLTEIFQLMGETLKKYQNISKNEEQKNRMYEYRYQNYTFKDEGSRMKVVVDFYDNTNITFDNYENFMSIFYSRLDEIKHLDVHYRLFYSVITPEPNYNSKMYSQTIDMRISEEKLDISLDLTSEDPKLNEVYDLIKRKVLAAPEKYDDVIKKKDKISNVVAFGNGLVPSIVITTALLFIPSFNTIFFKGYVVYPIVVLFFGYLIGIFISSSILEKYYKTIVPSKKYAGYDSNYNSVYKDDIDSYVGTSEIIIGKKVNNLENRKAIKTEYEKNQKKLASEILILLIISAVVIAIGLLNNSNY